MEAIDVVLSLIPTLTATEKEKVRQALGATEPTPCQRTGHKYPVKPIEVVTSIFAPKKKVFICSKCGHKLEM